MTKPRCMYLHGAILSLLVLAGCAAPREAEDAPDAQERALIAQLRRDPYVAVEQTWRDGDGNLVVETRQGQERRDYLLAADSPSDPTLRIRRIDRRLHLHGPEPERAGIHPVNR